jgi:hypothetical protein
MTFALIALLVPGTALAQTGQVDTSRNQVDTSKKLIKFLVGGSALAIGATVAAKSGQTTTVTSSLGVMQTSSFSTTQLVTGLAIAGAGGFLVWSAFKENRPSPSVSVGIVASKQARAVFVRRAW